MLFGAGVRLMGERASALFTGDEAEMKRGIGATEGRATAFGCALTRCALRALLPRCWLRGGRQRGAAETVGGALVKAYLNNPDINSSARRFAQRMRLYRRPTPAIFRSQCAANVGVPHTNSTQSSQGVGADQFRYGTHTPRLRGAAPQTIFDGMQTTNRFAS